MSSLYKLNNWCTFPVAKYNHLYQHGSTREHCQCKAFNNWTLLDSKQLEVMPLISQVALLCFTGVTVFHALLLARKPIFVSITASVNKLSARLRLLVKPPLGKISLARARLYRKSTLFYLYDKSSLTKVIYITRVIFTFSRVSCLSFLQKRKSTCFPS